MLIHNLAEQKGIQSLLIRTILQESEAECLQKIRTT